MCISQLVSNASISINTNIQKMSYLCTVPKTTGEVTHKTHREIEVCFFPLPNPFSQPEPSTSVPI